MIHEVVFFNAFQHLGLSTGSIYHIYDFCRLILLAETVGFPQELAFCYFFPLPCWDGSARFIRPSMPASLALQYSSYSLLRLLTPLPLNLGLHQFLVFCRFFLSFFFFCRFLQTEFNMDQMMPKGKEDEAPPVLAEDIDIQAAETLRDVVAHIASANDEVGSWGEVSLLPSLMLEHGGADVKSC